MPTITIASKDDINAVKDTAQKSLESHSNDSTKHITADERSKWNAAKAHADSAHAPSKAQENVIETIKVNGNTIIPDSKSVNITIPSSLPASDVHDWAKSSTKPSYTASEVGADPDGSANKALANAKTYTDTQISSAVSTKVDKVEGSSLISKKDLDQISTNKDNIAKLIGSGNGSIDTMIDEKINEWASKLTDDGVVNTYAEAIQWIADHGSEYTTLLGDVSNKVDKVSGKGLSTNDLTSSLKSNYDSAYTHSQSAHARTDATKVEKSNTNGNIKINGTETVVYTHPVGTNPHGTTKSDVGLGNVPNVSTNDQTPTYSDATTFATLTSGEKISVALGKIKLAITNLINHIANKNNPHGVTKAQVGLENVENKSSETIRNELTSNNIATALGYTPVASDTTYANFVKSGTGAKSGLVPAPPTTAGTAKYLREDGTWVEPPNTTYSSKTASKNGTDSSLVTTGEKYNWNTAKTHADSAHAPSNAQANIIESIKVNGNSITPTNKSVNITIPEVASATSSKAGITKIYDTTGINTDGTMSQKAITDAIGSGSGGSSTSTRKSIILDADNITDIDIPFTINDTKNLIVYLNGILLVPSIHYTSTTSKITLTGYEGKSGDIVTFIGNDSVSTSSEILATEVGIQDAAGNYPNANSVENALIQLANNTKNIVKYDSDTIMTAKFIAQNNTDYGVKQVRNIFLIEKSDAEISMPQGSSGDICIIYNNE